MGETRKRLCTTWQRREKEERTDTERERERWSKEGEKIEKKNNGGVFSFICLCTHMRLHVTKGEKEGERGDRRNSLVIFLRARESE